jgi:hypothetical protein
VKQSFTIFINECDEKLNCLINQLASAELDSPNPRFAASANAPIARPAPKPITKQ